MTHYPEQLPLKLPANVRHFDYIPFSQLLPHAAAIVHHGGIGTCSQALKSGVPQLIHPMAFDQLDNAARLEYLGVAKSITPRKYHAAKAATILRALIESPSVSKRCQAVAAKFDAADVLRDTCDLIEGVL